MPTERRKIIFQILNEKCRPKILESSFNTVLAIALIKTMNLTEKLCSVWKPLLSKLNENKIPGSKFLALAGLAFGVIYRNQLLRICKAVCSANMIGKQNSESMNLLDIPPEVTEFLFE